jgi:hypothetical protein
MSNQVREGKLPNWSSSSLLFMTVKQFAVYLVYLSLSLSSSKIKEVDPPIIAERYNIAKIIEVLLSLPKAEANNISKTKPNTKIPIPT